VMNMAEKKKASAGSRTLTMDLEEMYKYDVKDLVPEINHTRYSNLAYIHVSHRDVFIDFLEMPGTKKDGKMVISGTRIYMSHVAAEKMAKALDGILQKSHKDNAMEKFGDSRKK
jgi:hypothetical protein